MKYFKQQKNRGFTIVEMLIAVLIFTLSLAALMTIASRGLRVARQAQQQVVAEYLALEGIEAVRNIRDSAFIRFDDDTTWSRVFDNHGCLSGQSSGGNNGCEFELSNNAGVGEMILRPCSECRVKFSESSFSYRQGPTSANYIPSPYTRTIQLAQVATNEIIVIVTVAWDGGEVVYTEDLFLWLL